MGIAFIGQGATVGAGRTQIDLDGSAITSPVTHRTHATALSDGDLVDGRYYQWTVHKSDGNTSQITGRLNDAATDYIDDITWGDELGTTSKACRLAIPPRMKSKLAQAGASVKTATHFHLIPKLPWVLSA